MSIASGFQKIKDYIKRSTGDYILTSRWGNANTIECDDGKTVQSKVGGISGISSSLTANSATQAASTQLTNQLYQNITKLNSELEIYLKKYVDTITYSIDGGSGNHFLNDEWISSGILYCERYGQVGSVFGNIVTKQAIPNGASYFLLNPTPFFDPFITANLRCMCEIPVNPANAVNNNIFICRHSVDDASLMFVNYSGVTLSSGINIQICGTFLTL